MLEYVKKLTLSPGEMVETDLVPLRDAGFDDTGIGDIAMNCALFNYFLRIVDGLGASLEPGMESDAEQLGLGHNSLH